MSNFNDLAYHPVTLSNETTDLQSSPLSRISDAITKGIPAAAISGGLSIVNTVRDYGGADKFSTQEVISGFDEKMGDYYSAHEGGVDLAGFVATAFIPGTIGVKALKLAQGGEALGAVGRALNLTASNKSKYLDLALKETAASGGVVKGILSQTRGKQLIWETADAVLMNTAAELAIVASMNDSPVFDNSTLGDFTFNVALGGALGGAIGGTLGSVAAKGILNDAVKAIDVQKRVVDTVFDPKFMGLNKGTETLLFAESIAKLPDEFLNTPFTYRYAGETKEVVGGLPTASMLRDTRIRAVKTAEGEIGIKFNELANGNAAVGQGYRSLIQRQMQEAREAGKTADEVVEGINGYLNNVKSIGHIDLERHVEQGKKFYAVRSPTDPLNTFQLKREPGVTGKSAYKMADGVTAADLKVVSFIDTGHGSLKEAWKLGNDADIIMMPNGRAAINPRSAAIKRIADNPNRIRMRVDLETGSIADEGVVTFADVIQPGKLHITPTGVKAGVHSFPQVASKLTTLSEDALTGSARFAWASNMDITGLTRASGGVIDAADLPMVSRLMELYAEFGYKGLSKIKLMEKGTEINLATDIVDPMAYLRSKKIEVLAEQMGKGVPYDLRHIAAHTNTSVDFVEDAISRNYAPGRAAAGAREIPDLPTADALRPKTVEVEWEFSRTAAIMDPLEAYKQNFGPSFQATHELTRHYQLAIQQQINDVASNAALGEHAELFWKAPKELAQQSDQKGAGAGLWTASNASYGDTARLWVQDTGKNVGLVTQKMTDADVLALTPHINALRASPQASAELGMLTNALRKSEFRYVFDAADPQRLIATDVAKLVAKEGVSTDQAIAMLKAANGQKASPYSFELAHSATAEFLTTHSAINELRQGKLQLLKNAMGLTRGPSVPGVIYPPPINTAKYPYHAIVKTKEQIGVPSETTMLTAKSEDQLRKLVGQVDSSRYDVHFKADTDAYYKAKGEYDYDMAINSPSLNNELARTGKLSDFFPEVSMENVMTDYLEFHSKQVSKLVRTSVQVKNRQFFSEMQSLSENYRVVSESTSFGLGSKARSKISDPFGDYIKTALNISKQQEFPLLDSLNDFVDKIGVMAGDALARGRDQAMKGTISWQEADAIAGRFGLGSPYAGAPDAIEAYMTANSSYPRNLIKESFQKVNMMLANFTLRLDFANSLINIISTPILIGTEMQSIKGLVAGDAKLAGKLAELRSVQVPGQPYRAPSTTKLLANSINNYFGTDKVALIKRYEGIGAIKSVSRLYHEALDDLTFNSTLSPSHYYNKVNGAVDKLANYTGNNFSEELTRFVSADVMRQMSEPLIAAGKMTVKEQDAYISTFVNRVQGNYVTSQRPVVFQGTTGAAVSLFQTYAFNVLQQLHRHIQAGDKRTLAVFGGLQATVFGLNGVPFFDAVNTHLIGGMIRGNPEHKDAYSMLPDFNKDLGDWMLYGTASAFPLFAGYSPALYSRGDINPRHITVLPTNPMDVPAVSASLKLASTVYDFGKNMANGVDLGDAMLQGLEHQGWNRPLAGFAQLLAGRSTTSKGSLISAASEFQTTSWLGSLKERMVDYGGVGRLMGARPMDEAVALTALYRQKNYDALDRARMVSLGKTVKAALYGGEAPTEEQLDAFTTKYAASGGRIENFNQFMMRSMKDANVSVVNQTVNRLGTPTSRKMRQIMGDEGQLPDYANQEAPETPQE